MILVGFGHLIQLAKQLQPLWEIAPRKYNSKTDAIAPGQRQRHPIGRRRANRAKEQKTRPDALSEVVAQQ